MGSILSPHPQPEGKRKTETASICLFLNTSSGQLVAYYQGWVIQRGKNGLTVSGVSDVSLTLNGQERDILSPSDLTASYI